MNEEPLEVVENSSRTLIPTGNRGITLTSLEDIWRFAKFVSVSGLSPKGMEKPESILVAIQMGLELGLSPMAALQNIGIINGRPGIFGDAALALVRSSGLCELYTQAITRQGMASTHSLTADNLTAEVTSKRKGQPPLVTKFSAADAKRAGLWGKPGPWTQYPERMLLFRARGFNLRDNFSDVLKGFKTTEELQDYPVDSLPRSVPTTLPRAVEPNGIGEEQSSVTKAETQQPEATAPPASDPPRRKGRPIGSKNKPKDENPPDNGPESKTEPPNETQQGEPEGVEELDRKSGPKAEVISKIRAKLEENEISEGRLLALMHQWGWSENLAQPIEGFDIHILTLVDRKFDQVMKDA